MRFLHTSDWHLGRIYHGMSLLEDQAVVLDRFVALVRDCRPDAVLIAGDVYDRSVPPADAVRLLDETLTRIVVGAGVPVVLIAGNHDGPDRLGFGSRLLGQAGLTVRGATEDSVEPVLFQDRHGQIAVYPLPYAEPALVKSLLQDESANDHHGALKAQMARVRARHDAARRSIVVAHAFVQGGSVSESERPLTVGGSGSVGADVFDGVDFVALGHLHRPQAVGGDRIHYSGSLLKYSFAETGQPKSVSLVELDGNGSVAIERIALKPMRDLRVVEGRLAELVAAGMTDPNRGDLILARLTDEGALLDAMTRLRTAYPNALAIERLQFAGSIGGLEGGRDHRKIGMQQLFAGFFEAMTDRKLSAEAEALLAKEIEAIERSEREAST